MIEPTSLYTATSAASASGLFFLSMIPDLGAESDIAKIGLGGALAVSMWLNHKAQMSNNETMERISKSNNEAVGRIVDSMGAIAEKLSVLVEKLEHNPCLLKKGKE